MKVSMFLITLICFGLWIPSDAIYMPEGIWKYPLIDYWEEAQKEGSGKTTFAKFIEDAVAHNQCLGQDGTWFPTFSDFFTSEKDEICRRAENYNDCEDTTVELNIPENLKEVIKILNRNGKGTAKFMCENYDYVNEGISDGSISCYGGDHTIRQTIWNTHTFELIGFLISGINEGDFSKELEKIANIFQEGIRHDLSEDAPASCNEDGIQLRDEFLQRVDYSRQPHFYVPAPTAIETK